MRFRPPPRLNVMSTGKANRMTAHVIARSRTTVVLIAGAVVAWAVTVQRMRGMDAGPGTDLGGLGWYLGIWVTMTAAMMLPSAAPMVLAYSSFSRSRRSGTFVAGYLAAWTLFGLAAYVVYRLVAGAGIDWLR